MLSLLCESSALLAARESERTARQLHGALWAFPMPPAPPLTPRPLSPVALPVLTSLAPGSLAPAGIWQGI